MDKFLGIVKTVFGGSDIADKLLELFKGDKQKLREFQLVMADKLNEQFKAEIEDLQSARKMQIEALKQTDLFSKRFLYYLTLILMAATLFVAFFPLFWAVPENNITFVNRSQDFLFMVSGLRIIGFFFGKVNTKFDNL